MAKKTKKQSQERDLTPRIKILHEAAHAVSSARNVTYGEPQDDFACTSELWDSYIARITQVRGSADIHPWDVSVMMILLKISRLAQSPGEADHWIDIAGYAAIGAECAPQKCCD